MAAGLFALLLLGGGAPILEADRSAVQRQAASAPYAELPACEATALASGWSAKARTLAGFEERGGSVLTFQHTALPVLECEN